MQGYTVKQNFQYRSSLEKGSFMMNTPAARMMCKSGIMELWWNQEGILYLIGDQKSHFQRSDYH